MTQAGDTFEHESLELLRHLQLALCGALKSLEGKVGAGLFEHYLFDGSGYVNDAADGFIALRERGRRRASQLLVRPAVELMLRQQAILKHPHLLYRLAYTERLEDRKLCAPAYKRAGIDYDSFDQARWDQFSKLYANQYPSHSRTETKMTSREIARAAGIEGYYDSCYRLYCQFTHCSYRAMAGGLKNLSSEDNRTVALCVLGALEALAHGVNAKVSGLDGLRQQLFRLREKAEHRGGRQSG